MNIKSKLFISYSILLIIFIIVSSISFDAIKRWNETAENLKIFQDKSTQVENIRSMMYQQITLGREYIYESTITAERILELGFQVDEKIKEFQISNLSEEELNHFEALGETAVELDWIIKGTINLKENNEKEFDKNNARKRLSEIVDEITDDIFVLNKFYQEQISQSIASSKHAGEKAVYFIASSVAVVFVLLVILFVLNQRWLVKPIDSVNKITQLISNGKFTTRIESIKNDEWGDLAKSINNMARSLQSYEIRYRNQERVLALGEVAAYTAHNLQNPLAGIRAAVQYLKGKQNTDPETIEYYDDIMESIDRLNQWIKRFLAFAKPLHISKEKINLNNTVALALKAVKNKIDSTEITIELNTNDIPEITADEILLEQVISVFVNNALEANSKTINISTNTEKDKDGYLTVLLTIEDDGYGISEQVKKKLFQAFVTTKQNGTGLGLAQAKKIVDLHYGKLKIESVEKLGTKIILMLPVQN